MGSRRRKLTPEFEHDLNRDPRLGYEAPNTSEFVRCVEHGSPTPLERWHCHDVSPPGHGTPGKRHPARRDEWAMT
jgi:hypothetical protein